MTARPFGIGWLATQTGRSVHTIRWYEGQGLIPGVTRDSGRRRVYAPEHVQWLALMHRLRQTGMSIAQMRRYTVLVTQGRRTLGERRNMLAAHRTEVMRSIVEWQEALQLIDHKIDFYGEWLATGHRPRELPSPRPLGGQPKPKAARRRRSGAPAPAP